MSPETQTAANRKTHPFVWLAGAAGAAIGVASWAYTHRKQSRWERTKERAEQLVNRGRKELKPWMGWTAGTAVGCAGVAYQLSKRKETAWQRSTRQAGAVLSRTRKEWRPWMGVAASAAVSIASTAYRRKARQTAKDNLKEGVAVAADKVADAGVRLLRRVQRISSETGKLYPRVRRLIA